MDACPSVGLDGPGLGGEVDGEIEGKLDGLFEGELDGDVLNKEDGASLVWEVGDLDRTSSEGKASSVQFIHFKFNESQIEKFKSGSKQVELGIDHTEYSHTTKLTIETIGSLSADFI